MEWSKFMTKTKEYVSNPRNLEVYRKSLLFVSDIYKMAKRLPSLERYSICDQICRAVNSVTANIAEGNARIFYKEEFSFLNVSVGSLVEVRAFLDICLVLDYLKPEEHDQLDNQAEEILKMLIGKMNSIKRITD